MNRVKIRDFIVEAAYDFPIWDIEDRLIFIVNKAFTEANVEHYFWIDRVVYDRHNNIHIDFEYLMVDDSEEIEQELKELILAFVKKTYEIYILEEKYRDKLTKKYPREGKVIYLEDIGGI